LARDCGRGEGLHFFRGRGFVVFATHLPDLLDHPDVPRELDEVVLAHQLAGNIHQRRRTVFRGIERVPSRTAVIITRDATEHRVYWEPTVRASALYSRDEDYIERARELLDQAVTRVLSDSPKFAVMASGGLDSSAVLATLARRGLSHIPCYTYVPSEPVASPASRGHYSDERPRTEALAARYPALRFHYRTAADLHADVRPDEARFERWPLPVSNIAHSRIMSSLRRAISADGFQVVLTGTPGNLSLSWAGDDLMPQLAARGRLLALWREARATAHHESTATLRVLAHSTILPLLPASAKELLVRLRGQAGYLAASRSPLRPDVIRDFRLPEAWREDGFNPHARWLRSTREFRIGRMFDRPYTIHDRGPANDALYGIQMRDPLADRDLFEFCLNVPERLFHRNGVARWFARAVLADRIPRDIVDECRRGSQTVPWSIATDRDAIATELERMEHSLMASRLFDIPRLRRLARDWPDNVEADQASNLAYMALEQAVYVFRFMRWISRGNA
jgi:asparagine synthase (glutamine-hydrolysing)